MRVYFRLGAHHIFKPLVSHPPKGVRYTVPEYAYRKYPALNVVKNAFWYNFTKYVPPAVRVNPPAGTDLVFSTGGIAIKNKMPWITNIESPTAFCGHHPNALRSSAYRRAILKNVLTPYCKRIVADSEAALRATAKVFPELKSRMIVLYFPVEPKKPVKRKRDGLRILFVGKRFYMKGGHVLCKAYDALKQTHDVSLTVVSDVPNDYRVRYSADENVRMLTNIPRAALEDEYKKADVFFFGSHFDTYGVAMVEAMSYGLPVVAVKQYSSPEIVDDGVNGFLVNTSAPTLDDFVARASTPNDRMIVEITKNLSGEAALVGQVTDKLRRLADDRSLLERMSKAAYKKANEGELSLKAANVKLKRVYEEAVR